MKAIILAAGRGSRMGALTEQTAKCMLEVCRKPLLHHAVERLARVGVTDIVVVRGYRPESVACEGVRFIDNMAWGATNMLGTLFSAADELHGELLITYSDIVFTADVVEAALASRDDVQPVVDLVWRDAYVGRTGHPFAEAEKVILADSGLVAQIGKRNVDEAHADAEFIGMLRLSAEGAAAFKACYAAVKQSQSAGPFQTADSLSGAYITDLLQEMIDRGTPVAPIAISGGWREIDTEQDLLNADAWFQSLR